MLKKPINTACNWCVYFGFGFCFQLSWECEMPSHPMLVFLLTTQQEKRRSRDSNLCMVSAGRQDGNHWHNPWGVTWPGVARDLSGSWAPPSRVIYTKPPRSPHWTNHLPPVISFPPNVVCPFWSWNPGCVFYNGCSSTTHIAGEGLSLRDESFKSESFFDGVSWGRPTRNPGYFPVRAVSNSLTGSWPEPSRDGEAGKFDDNQAMQKSARSIPERYLMQS